MFSLLFAGIGTVIPAIFLVFFSLLKLVPFQIEFCDCMIHTIHGEESEKVDKAYRLDYVHSVIDYGSYYYLKHFPVPSKIVCQKNLLIEGTLEEFEANVGYVNAAFTQSGENGVEAKEHSQDIMMSSDD